jgi:hypothetical protein
LYAVEKIIMKKLFSKFRPLLQRHEADYNPQQRRQIYRLRFMMKKGPIFICDLDGEIGLLCYTEAGRYPCYLGGEDYFALGVYKTKILWWNCKPYVDEIGQITWEFKGNKFKSLYISCKKMDAYLRQAEELKKKLEVYFQCEVQLASKKVSKKETAQKPYRMGVLMTMGLPVRK